MRYKGIDCLRLLMAVVVVSIHTTDWRLLGLTSVAVPFFFVVSGFFLFLKMPGGQAADRERLGKWTLRVVKMYLVWTAVYLPFTIYGFVKDSLTLRQSVLAFGRNVLLVGENYLSWPLWFLLGLVWCGVLFYVLRSLKVPSWGVLAVGALLSAVPLLLAGNPVFDKLFPKPRIFSAFLYVSIGGALGLLKVPPLPTSLTSWIPDRLAVAFRDASAVIYLTHMLFAGILILFFHMEQGALMFSITLLCAAVTSVAYLLLKPSRKK